MQNVSECPSPIPSHDSMTDPNQPFWKFISSSSQPQPVPLRLPPGTSSSTSNQSEPSILLPQPHTDQNTTESQSLRVSNCCNPPCDTVVHKRHWTVRPIISPLNGDIRSRAWQIATQSGDVFKQHSRQSDVSPISCFFATFRMSYFSSIWTLTNNNLKNDNLDITTNGEILKFFGILILITRFEFSSRRDLWKRKDISKYIPSAQFGRFISRDRFQHLMQHIQLSMGAPHATNGSVVTHDENEKRDGD